METVSISVIFNIMQELLGSTMFWLLTILAIVLLGAYIYAWTKTWKATGKLFTWPSMMTKYALIVGVIVPILTVYLITDSGLSDIGGAIDIFALLFMAAGGVVFMYVFCYVTTYYFGKRLFSKKS